jgi:hypothetical protein
MKKTFIIIFALFTSTTIAQELKEVTLTEIGQGKTKDDAKYSALRNALEKAFGTFISSNTTIFKDELVKDEIVSLSSGNIQKFEILSETQMPDGSFLSVVKATVSIGKLTSFCESKGIAVEFKGGLFAANIKLQELNKKNEKVVINNLFYNTINKIIDNSFDYDLKISEPKYYRNNYWIVPLKVNISFNTNWDKIIEIIENTFEGIKMSQSEISDYKNLNINVYFVNFNDKIYYFRSNNAIFDLIRFFDLLVPLKMSNFNISNGISLLSFHDIYNCLDGKEHGVGAEYGFDREIFFIKNCKYFSDKEISIKLINHNFFKYQNRFYDVRGFSTFQVQEYLNQKLEYNNNAIILKTPKNLGRVININNILDINELSKISEYKVQPITK